MKNKKLFGGAENNINQKFNYNFNPLNEQQALEAVSNEYIKGDKNKFKRGDNKRFLEVNPAGDGPKRLANGHGIRVKNLTNKSRNEFLSKPRKYKRRSKKTFGNLPNHLQKKISEQIGMMGNVGNVTKFARSAKHKLGNNNRRELFEHNRKLHDRELLRKIIPLENKRDEYFHISAEMHTVYDQHERGRYYYDLAREVDQEINALFQQLSPELRDLLLNMQAEYEASSRNKKKSLKSKIKQDKLNIANGKLEYLDGRLHGRFNEGDKNKDGKMSREEWAQSFGSGDNSMQLFNAYDAA